MGRKLHFKMGSFYRTDDRTGFPTRAEDTRREWNGLIVDVKRWEPRQPQDLVKGRPDNQTVPFPRPLGPNIFVGPFNIQIASDVAIGATFIPLPSISGISDGDPVGIMLDNGVVFRTTVQGPPISSGVNIAGAMPYTAASGNLFFDYEPEPMLSQTEHEDFGP
jgi:hypothetical protein